MLKYIRNGGIMAICVISIFHKDADGMYIYVPILYIYNMI